ncbi:MAG: hypothetical protein KGL39_58350 [Patescibacteria group bacterium]|nr:hypothetical protein [Patescibacteria group bacterium]
MSEAQIKHMVDRFLCWRLPDDFSPDAGISFKRTHSENTPWAGRHEPVGTNLLSATQAEAMVRHMIEGLPPAPQDTAKRTSGGQIVGRTPLRCEPKGASDYCCHCTREIGAPGPCPVLEKMRLDMIPDSDVLAFGCQHEASVISLGYPAEQAEPCEKWCHRPECAVTLAPAATAKEEQAL